MTVHPVHIALAGIAAVIWLAVWRKWVKPLFVALARLGDGDE